MSGYALVASEWGARVAGWDAVRTPYLAALEERRIEIVISPELADPPPGFEVVVSTAYRERAGGSSRAEFLAELVSLRPSIVVAGAHGKTTTSGMIAFCLERLGGDPAFVIGGEIPQLGGNAGAGSGWFVVEGDESDRTIESLRPRIAVVTNVDIDHHTTFGSRAEVEELYEQWLSEVPHGVRGEALAPVEVELALAGEHNRRNAACALAAVELAGFDRSRAAAVLAEFRGAGRRLEHRGEAGGVTVLDDYAHHPAEITATIAAVRERWPGRVLVLFQPHLYSRTRHLAREFAAALAEADAVAVTEIYPAREAPVDGVTGKLIVDAVAERRPGVALAWTPAAADGARFLARRAREGDLVLTLGAGDVDRAVPVVLEELA
ncbi:MAG: Mur ligase family protein [Actinomycetota bacterium]|nr:Mur ligase family protein [Actinomycetota bacterium]